MLYSLESKSLYSIKLFFVPSHTLLLFCIVHFVEGLGQFKVKTLNVPSRRCEQQDKYTFITMHNACLSPNCVKCLFILV